METLFGHAKWPRIRPYTYIFTSGTSNNNDFADLQMLIVKNVIFFPQKCQHKYERPSLPLPSGISYKPIGNTVHPWHNIEHALCILELEAALFGCFAKIWGYFACMTKNLQKQLIVF